MMVEMMVAYLVVKTVEMMVAYWVVMTVAY
jgi:hypothetical protein